MQWKREKEEANRSLQQPHQDVIENRFTSEKKKSAAKTKGQREHRGDRGSGGQTVIPASVWGKQEEASAFNIAQPPFPFAVNVACT
jgi:hypothetical protein